MVLKTWDVRADDVPENVARANHAVTMNMPVAISTEANMTPSRLHEVGISCGETAAGGNVDGVWACSRGGGDVVVLVG